MAATLREYLDKLGVLTLWAQIKDIFATKEEVSVKADTADVLIPNFDGMTPVKVIEFDKSAANWSKLFTRANTGISTTMSEVQDVVLMRITVTGTNIYSRSDVVIKFQPGLVNPHVYAFHHTYSGSAATTGLQYLRFNYPKALNNNISWMVDFYQYNATARHYRIEVFATTENITWEESLIATTYNSTDYSTAQITLYTRRGLCALGQIPVDVLSAGYSTSAAYISSYLNKWLGGIPVKAGEALVDKNLVFSNGGYVYKISNKEKPIEAELGICRVGTTYAINASITSAYLRTIGVFDVFNSGDAITYDSFVFGDSMYLRCVMKGGRIYSDAHLAPKMVPGYTWYFLGAMSSSTALSLNVTGSHFITLDDNGYISHIDGNPTNATTMTEGIDKEDTFLKRAAVSGNAEVKSIEGNSIVWNQLIENGDFSRTTTGNTQGNWEIASSTFSISEGVLSVVRTNSTPIIFHRQLFFPNKHIFYVSVYIKRLSDEDDPSYIKFYNYNASGGQKASLTIYPSTEGGRIKSLISWTTGDADAINIYLPNKEGASYELSKIRVFDLTQMFGPGNEPTTVGEFEKLFPEDYYEYETGTLLNLEMTGIKTEDSNGTEVDSETFNVKTLTGIASGGSTAETIFPYGMCSIGGVQDEIDFVAGKAVKRFGVVDISSLDITRLVSGTRDIYHAPLSDAKLPANSAAKPSVMCAGYLPQERNGTWTAGQVVLPEVNSTINAGRIGFVTANNIYTDAAAFKSAMSGACLVYELATPIEYSITASAPTYKSAKGGVEKVLPYDDNDVLTAPITAVVHYENKAITLDDDIAYLGEDDGEGHIAAGGEVNVIETIKVNGNALVPDSNKAVDLQVKTINNQSIIGTGNISIQGGSGGGGDENVIEVVKVNGTALTPDANKAVDITIPAAITESTVSGWGFTKNSGTYSKPSGGIPKTDLASAVQTSLGLADTALQSFTESDPTVPAWAKASNKPTYTASEVGALPDTTVIPAAPGTLNTTATTAQTTNSSEALSGSITLHKVAKTGTYSDLIGTPTNVSSFTNDAGYITSASVVTIYSGSTTPSSSLGNNGDIYIKTS